jgi:orotate phosphoribosyltransferase
VLLVADDLETGAPIQLLLPALYAAGAHPIAAAVVVRRTAELTEIEAEGRDPIPLIAGITLNLPTYEPVDCPLCAAGEPIVTPGSSGR